MTRIHVGVLGPANFALDDAEIRLTPLTVKLLLRLVIASGDIVSANRLYLDIWDTPVNGMVTRAHRIQVQKRVVELRRAIDPERRGEGTRILSTEQVLAVRGPELAYRLQLTPDQLDVLEFAELVNRAAHAAPATAVALLTRALRLWRGKPLPEVSGLAFATPLIRRLTTLHETARRELVRAHTELGHVELALPIAEELAEEQPDDAVAVETLRQLRAGLRARHGDEVMRREFTGLRAAVVIKRGDLFDQDDANIVAGFGDTFDTVTEGDLVISRESVQGQLLHRLYGGDRTLLDKELRRGLRPFTPMATEPIRDKSKGKRVRYPIGTVVALPLPGRRAFAVAYCKQDNDFVTRSSPEALRLSLDRLWDSITVHGLYKPVAMPLVGSGLARIRELNREQLMIMIIDSFLRACRSGLITPELRIVIRPAELGRMRMSDVARFVESLDQDGRNPYE